MTSLKQSAQLTGRKALLITLVLLPICCLLLQWNALDNQVALHFSRGGADTFGSKNMLIGLVLMPLLLYSALPFIYQAEAKNNARRQIVVGTIIFLSLVLCVLLLAGTSLDK